MWRMAGLPVASNLDLPAVLAVHPTAQDTLRSRASAWTDFWMALVGLVADAKAKATDSTRLEGRSEDGRHSAYLRFLPRIALDPLLWLVKEQAALLVGTLLSQETRRELKWPRE